MEVWQGRADHTDLLAPLEGWQEDGGDVGGGDVPLSGVQGALHPVAVHRPHHLQQGGRAARWQGIEENGNTAAVQLAGLGKYKHHLSHPRHGVRPE